jgi:hypothetical protein
MILGSFGFVFASDYPDVKDNEYYSEPVNVLSGLGVIGGFTDGTYRPDSEVTRAQMATMIVNALGMTVTGKSDTKFSDVKASHWASGFINYAASVGFIAGYPDGTFKPEQQVTYDQALTMIVAALGYKADALTGSWPGNFVNQARGLGILDTCKTTGTANAPRKDIACFLYDALDAYIGITDKDGAFHPTEVSKNNYDCMLARLGATPYVPTEGPTKGEEGGEFIVTGSEKSLINLGNYLGALITAYQNKDKKIVAVKEVKSQYIEGTYKSLKADYNFATETDDAIFFENGDTDAKYTMTEQFKTFDGDSTNLKLAVDLSGKKVSEVYSIQAWTPDKTDMAKSDVQDEILDDKALIGMDFAKDDDKEIDADTYTIVGKDSIKDIVEDDVVTVYLHKAGDNAGKIAKVEVSNKTIEGKITKISNDAPKDAAYTIGGTAYYLNEDMTTDEIDKLDDMMADGTSATFYLDYAGNIFTYEEAEETTSNYAVILETGADNSRYGEKTAYIKLFLADGTVKEFEVHKDVHGGVKADMSWTKPFTNGVLVEYAINSKDVVKELTPAAGAPADKTFDKNGVVDGNVLKDDTVVFSYNGEGETDPDNYEVIKASKLFDSKVEDMTSIAKSGNFKAVLLSGVSTDEKEYALFVEKTGTNADGQVWTALYEGKVQDLTLESAPSAVVKDIVTSGAATVFTLSLDSKNVATPKAQSPAKAVAAVFDTFTKETSVSNNIFKCEGKNYSLESEIEVYVYSADDEEWTAAKDASAMAGRKTKFDKIILIDVDADNIYDIALVYNK